MIKFSKLIELPIINVSSGNKTGTIYDVIFTPDNMQIIAFIIVLKKLFVGKKVVLFKDIETVGENAVFIQDGSKMMNITQWHMPENACMWRVQCQACHRDIVTLPGKCCVFCSYGSHPSPPIQRAQHEGKGGCGCCSES